MSRRLYVPDRGDFVWITLNPTAGHEQTGRRPALVVSPKSYNRRGQAVMRTTEVFSIEGEQAARLPDELRFADSTVSSKTSS